MSVLQQNSTSGNICVGHNQSISKVKYMQRKDCRVYYNNHTDLQLGVFLAVFARSLETLDVFGWLLNFLGIHVMKILKAGIVLGLILN